MKLLMVPNVTDNAVPFPIVTEAGPVPPGAVSEKSTGFGLAVTAALPVPLTAMENGLPDTPV